MATFNVCASDKLISEEDKITNKELMKLLGLTTQEFSVARKYRPEDFPKGKRNGRTILYPKKEMIEFFSQFGFTVKEG